MKASLDPRPQVLDLLLDPQLRPVQEHRWAADDLHVAEAEVPEVALRELPANPDGRPALQDRGDEAADGPIDRGQRAEVVVEVRLRADAEDDDRDAQPFDQLRPPLQSLRVLRPEGVREREDVHVVLRVDPIGIGRADSQLVGRDPGVRRGEEPVRGMEEDAVAGVVGVDVAGEDLVETEDVERALGERSRMRTGESAIAPEPSASPSGYPARTLGGRAS